MLGRKTLVVLVVLALLAVGALAPPRAEAGVDLEQSLIIAGATAGALALITFIAILASSDEDEPDFLTEAKLPDRKDHPGIRFGFQATRSCPPVGGNISLACW